MSDINFFDMVENELAHAQESYPKFNSEHEGFAVLKEEVDELWEAVRMKQSNPNRSIQIRRETVQVAAMAFRFLYDLCEPKYTPAEILAHKIKNEKPNQKDD